MFDLINYSTKSKYDDSNKLVIGEMKDETADVAMEEFFGLKPKMYLFLLDDSNKYKKLMAETKILVTMNIKMFW